MWRECMEALGGKYLLWSNTPDNPNYNKKKLKLKALKISSAFL